MAGSTANPRIWVNADVYTAALGTTAPTDVTTAWSGSWSALGLLSEDGMTETRDMTVTDYFAWGGGMIRTTRSKFKRTLKIKALEDNATVWGLVNPGSTKSASGGVTTRSVKIQQPDKRAFGIETKDGSITRRIVVPQGEIIEVGPVTSADSSIAMYELPIHVYADAAGLYYTELTNDPAA
jgi:hypothetical protein